VGPRARRGPPRDARLVYRAPAIVSTRWRGGVAWKDNGPGARLQHPGRRYRPQIEREPSASRDSQRGHGPRRTSIGVRSQVGCHPTGTGDPAPTIRPLGSGLQVTARDRQLRPGPRETLRPLRRRPLRIEATGTLHDDYLLRLCRHPGGSGNAAREDDLRANARRRGECFRMGQDARFCLGSRRCPFARPIWATET
jgi:hypothetical protein